MIISEFPNRRKSFPHDARAGGVVLHASDGAGAAAAPAAAADSRATAARWVGLACYLGLVSQSQFDQ